MKSLLSTFVIFLLIVFSTNGFAQEEKPPNFLVVSQNMVKMDQVGLVNQLIDSIGVPVLQELVDEGMLAGFGQFNHVWGDQWNVNFWYVAEDMASFSAAWDEYIKRVGERHPGSFASIVEHFQAHKDNMYEIQYQYPVPPAKE